VSSIDRRTVDSFGEEWSAFDQSGAGASELAAIWRSYFAVFPSASVLVPSARGIDVGCGSGRWAAFVAPSVGQLWCVDPSPKALGVASGRLDHDNVRFACGAAGALPFGDGTFDFAYSLGVLHHTPDTAGALADCVRVLRPGAPFLVYLYYALDDRPAWFRALWRLSDAVRRWTSARSFPTKRRLANAIGVAVYWPLARSARLVERVAGRAAAERVPLALYRDKSLYVMRNDALDRFGTPLEQRFTRSEIESMMTAAGLERIEFSPDPPFWCAVGYRRWAT
jgi:SAM-dependent methyltransferase